MTRTPWEAALPGNVQLWKLANTQETEEELSFPQAFWGSGPWERNSCSKSLCTFPSVKQVLSGTKRGKWHGATGTLISGVNTKRGASHFGGQFAGFLQSQAYSGSSNLTPCYLLKGAEGLCLYKNLCQMFTAVLFIIAIIWKEPRYPSVGEWINSGPSAQWNIIHG